MFVLVVKKKMADISLISRVRTTAGTLGGRNFVRVRNVVVAAIFDLTTVEDWGE